MAKRNKRLSSIGVSLQENDDVRDIRVMSPAAQAGRTEREKGPSVNTTHGTDWVGSINDIYKDCLKLGAQNKINSKNAWNLKLVDVIKESGRETEKRSDSHNISYNFQVASNTLDTSVKIYASRVDSVHTDTYKVLGGLNRTNVKTIDKIEHSDDEDEQEERSENQANTANRRSKRRQSALLKTAECTLETNLNNINIKKLETEVAVDPMFRKTSEAFDEGGVKGLLLAQLGVSDNGNVVFDMTEYDPDQVQALAEQVGEREYSMDVICQCLDKLWVEYDVCPYYSNFSFNDDTQTQLPTNLNELHNSQQAPSNEFEIPPTDEEMGFVDDTEDEDDGFNDMGFDDIGVDNADEEEEFGEMDSVEQQYPVHAKDVIGEVFGAPSDGGEGGGRVMSDFNYVYEMLGEGTDEYSFFTKRLMENWAGPEHWKFRQIPNKAIVENKSNGATKGRKKKEFFIDFSAEDPTDYIEAFKKPANSSSTMLSAQVLQKSTSNTLPPDMHFDIARLTHLFLRPDRSIGFQRVDGTSISRGEKEEVSSEMADPSNWTLDDDDDDQPLVGFNAFDGFDDEDGSDGVADFGASEGCWDDVLPQTDRGALGDNDLVEAPEKIRMIPINFEKRAKKVDIEKLKGSIWQQLVPTIEHMEPEATESDTSFREVLTALPGNIPANQLPDVSVPLCFICLLDLANKKGLQIQTETSQGDADLRISKYAAAI